MRRVAGSVSVFWWVGAAALIGLVTTGSFLVAYHLWNSSWGLTDRLTAMADSFACAALIDAALGGWVAVAAYYQATRKPNLLLLVALFKEQMREVALSGQKTPVYEFKRRPVTTIAAEVIEFHVSLKNLSRYSARNPSLRMHLDLSGVNVGGTLSHGWVLNSGRTSIQWDGGADLSVHGSWERAMPLLQLQAHGPARDQPYGFRCEVVADGFRRDFEVLIRFVPA
jgi:hypothetical protein